MWGGGSAGWLVFQVFCFVQKLFEVQYFELFCCLLTLLFVIFHKFLNHCYGFASFDTQQYPGSKDLLGKRALPDNLNNTRRFLRVSGILNRFFVISVKPKIRQIEDLVSRKTKGIFY